MALREGQAREALLYVLVYVAGNLRVARAPPTGQLLGEEKRALPAGGEHPAQTFRQVFTPAMADHPEEVPRVVHLAPLVRDSLEMAPYGRLQALVLIGDDQLDAREPPSL